MDPATGHLWDVKGFHSGYSTGYDVNTATTVIGGEISLGEDVIIDTTKMSQTHIEELRAACAGRPEWAGKVLWWP